MYIDCRYGQLHVATAYPASGGFDEAAPIVFLHAEDGAGADFNRCAVLLGADRSVYAPDLPGNGGSDAPKGRMAIAGLALAVVDLLEQLRLKRVDLVGAGRGALVAYELAATRPQDVRRLVIAGNQEPATPAGPADAPGIARPRPRPRRARRRPRRRDPRLPRPSLGDGGGLPPPERERRDQHGRKQRQRRQVEPLPADGRHRDTREQGRHGLRAEHEEIVQGLCLDRSPRL